MKNDIIYTNVLELINGTDYQFSEASISLNPMVNWMKFVLLDDLPNGNKQRVPKSEFDNIIKTGIHMPIKVSAGEISPGHQGAFPIGVITNLKVEDNKIIGLAALWSEERSEDVKLLLDKYHKGEPLNVSWELYHKDQIENKEEGFIDLVGVTLSAATLVGIPAYKGRTNVLSLASLLSGEDDTIEEDSKLEELEQLKLDKQSLEEKIAALETDIKTKDETVNTLTAEMAELKKYKEDVEAVKQAEEKFSSIKTKFSEAGLTFDEQYFIDRKEKLLAMSEEDVDFFVQEVVSFSKKDDKEEASIKIPAVRGKKTPDNLTLSEIAKQLREIK